MHALLRVPALVAAMAAVVLPYRYWTRFPAWMPLAAAAVLSGIATIFLGAAIGIPGFLDHAHGNASTAIDRALAYMTRTEVYRGDLVIGFSGMSIFSFLLLTPTGWVTLYLLATGTLRAGAAWFDDPIGDPLLTGLDYAIGGRRETRRIANARKAREALEGPDVPDRIVSAAAAGLPPCDLVVVASRQKPGWERGVTVLTADAAYRIGDPVERTVAGRLRTLYPLTVHGDLEAIRRSVHYDLPSTMPPPE